VEAARRAKRQHENVERVFTRLRSEFESLKKGLAETRRRFAPPPAEEKVVEEVGDEA